LKLNDQQIEVINSYGCKVIHTGCSKAAAEDKTLPNNAYLLTLVKGEETWHDIVMGMQADIFDAYYDMFGHVMKKMDYAKGTRNPKLWGLDKKKK
jgi:hypothetical protein